jgi:hypothetical protein
MKARKKALARKRSAQAARALKAANIASDPMNMWPYFIGDNMRFVTSPVSEAVNRMTRAQVINLLNRAAGDTPTPPVYKSATSAVGIASVSIRTTDLPEVGGQTPTGYLFPLVIVEIASSVLNALPASLMVTTVLKANTMYLGEQNLLQQGQLVVQPAETTKRLAFCFVPWITINSAPQPVLGSLTANNGIDITIEGLPDATVLNVILGGTTHPSVHMMRTWAETGVLPPSQQKAILQSSFLHSF